MLSVVYTTSMHGYYTYPDGGNPGAGAVSDVHVPHVAVVTQGVKLGDETRGYTRFRFIAELLAHKGFEVDLITSTFQHWDKAQRDTTRECYQDLPYSVQFVYEPGYQRNLDPQRVKSHHVFARNLRGFLESRFQANSRAYDLVYSEIPPNDMARVCAEVAHKYHVPYVPDVNDLWPEAMRMAIDLPVISDIAFAPFSRDAKKAYRLMAAAVGTSDEYADRPAKDREAPYEKRTVYVGNRLDEFDAGVQARSAEVAKPEEEIWVTYAGTLGASYDIATLIRAAVKAAKRDSRIRVKLLGDGPNREQLEELAASLCAPVDFVGYVPYDLMAAYLAASDITVNSLVKGAAQSIVTKIGDYLAAGIPMINTGSSPEFCAKVEHDGFGLNVQAEDADVLAQAMIHMARKPEWRANMGVKARAIAEEQFDQEHSYQVIVDLIRKLTD